MLDGHIHLERGPYTPAWVREFVEQARRTGMEEIWLLEHSYRFREFTPLYRQVTAASQPVAQWFARKAGRCGLADYLGFVEHMKKESFPIRVRFGLEVCYFQQGEEEIGRLLQGGGLDFAVGSVHFVDSFAFDQSPDYWRGRDVDQVYRRFFETTLDLIDSGLFQGLAHPDSVKIFGFRPSFSLEPFYDQVARALARRGMYAEENSGVYRRSQGKGGLGLEPAFLKALRRQGVSIVTASDAHCPQDVGAQIPWMNRLLAQFD